MQAVQPPTKATGFYVLGTGTEILQSHCAAALHLNGRTTCVEVTPARRTPQADDTANGSGYTA